MDFFEKELAEAIQRRRPRYRADCRDQPRPCPFVSCRHHLYLEVTGNKLKINVPDRAVWEMESSCSLDLADAGDMRLASIGTVLGLTRERIRQIEAAAIDAAREKEAP